MIRSLLCLTICLLLCARSGAAPEKKEVFDPDLQYSTFTPGKSRDPFSPVGFKAGVAAPVEPTVALELEGIFYRSTDRSAIVNGLLLPLNKSVTYTVGDTDVKLKAVEITRDHVVVEVGSRKIELSLNPQSQPPAPSK